MGSISHFQFAEHLLEGSSSLHFPTSNIDDLRREIATTIMTGSGEHFKSLNRRAFLIKGLNPSHQRVDLCHFCGVEDTFDKTKNVTWVRSIIL
jgi:hypothetical protein